MWAFNNFLFLTIFLCIKNAKTKKTSKFAPYFDKKFKYIRTPVSTKNKRRKFIIHFFVGFNDLYPPGNIFYCYI